MSDLVVEEFNPSEVNEIYDLIRETFDEFVGKDYQGQSIGKRLLQSAVESVKGKTTYLEVNASPYSEKIYSALGFKKVGGLEEGDGIKFVPMKMIL